MRCWSNYVLEPFWPQLAPTELAPFVEWRCLASYPKLAGLLLAGDGEKTPILALHGWLDNAGSMQQLLAHLHGKLGATSLALDLPGHGCSEHTAALHVGDRIDDCQHAIRRRLAAVFTEGLKPAPGSSPGVQSDEKIQNRAERVAREVFVVEAQPRPMLMDIAGTDLPNVPERGEEVCLGLNNYQVFRSQTSA